MRHMRYHVEYRGKNPVRVLSINNFTVEKSVTTKVIVSLGLDRTLFGLVIGFIRVALREWGLEPNIVVGIAKRDYSSLGF